MRNIDKWKPSRLRKDPRTGRFTTHRVYGGSAYLADLQNSVYFPLFSDHLSGSLLDVGCGPVPYFEVYHPLVSENICVDHPGCVHGLEHLDHLVDLNAEERLPFPDERFDSVLATDMIVHMHRPEQFVREVARVLRPGGKAIITSTFVNWMGEYPNEYFHPSGPGLRMLANSASLEVLHLESYGGHADVFMDTLNKFMASGHAHRLFRFIAWSAHRFGWPARDRVSTRDRYAVGNTMVVRKPISA